MIRNGKIKIFSVYLHRYVRMTPLLAVSMLVSMSLLRFLGNGPFWPIVLDFNTGHCEHYWWSTLIYVQNYVNPKNIVSILDFATEIGSSYIKRIILVFPSIVVFERRYATLSYCTSHSLFNLSIQN